MTTQLSECEIDQETGHAEECGKFRIPTTFEFSWQKREHQKGGHSIDLLELPTLAWNCLRRSQIDTIEELLEFTPKDILEIKNIGKGSLYAIKKALNDKGYANFEWRD